MKTEFEIKFTSVDLSDLKSKLESLQAKQIKQNTLMKRVIFDNPITPKNSYVRIRDEWDKITLTYKNILSWDLNINSVQEIELEVSDFDSLKNIFINLWLKQKSYQETYRETWAIWEEVYFMIDVWPWLKPFVEVEWESEELVKKYCEKLWFDYSKWLFWTVDQVYLKELWISADIINNLSSITFENPPKK